MADTHTPRNGSTTGEAHPDPAVLPSPRSLARATISAVAVAFFLAIGVVMPAEYGRDPLGTGALLGLTEMGRIKVALAAESAAGEADDTVLADGSTAGTAAAGAMAAAPGTHGIVATSDASRVWRDSVTVTLQPNEGIEFKLAMRRAERALYEWATDSTVVSYNFHGDPSDADEEDHTYRRGNSKRERGEMVARFDGLHGWFWRNRSTVPVTIRLWTGGEYLELREIE
jgi:hypothetical protein